jgi:hypothetical protein
LRSARRRPILDGIVKTGIRPGIRHRRFSRRKKKIEAALWSRAEAMLPLDNVEAYTQGLMDLGAGAFASARGPAATYAHCSTTCMARREDRIAALPAARPKKTIPQKIHRDVDHDARAGGAIGKAAGRKASGAGCGAFPKFRISIKTACRVAPPDSVRKRYRRARWPMCATGSRITCLPITPALLQVTRLETARSISRPSVAYAGRCHQCRSAGAGAAKFCDDLRYPGDQAARCK